MSSNAPPHGATALNGLMHVERTNVMTRNPLGDVAKKKIKLEDNKHERADSTRHCRWPCLLHHIVGRQRLSDRIA
jgi:hypothetical protein